MNFGRFEIHGMEWKIVRPHRSITRAESKGERKETDLPDEIVVCTRDERPVRILVHITVASDQPCQKRPANLLGSIEDTSWNDEFPFLGRPSNAEN